MRTTVDLRDDVLQAARAEVVRSGTAIGEVLSNWAERGRYAPVTIGLSAVQFTDTGYGERFSSDAV